LLTIPHTDQPPTTASDVDQLTRAELVEALLTARRAALTDPLTGLPNRAALGAELSRRAGTRYALLLIDLDEFKTVNDTLGHTAGDGVLVAVARILGSLPGTFAARLGGDEFIAITDADDSERLAYAIHAAIGRTVLVGASIGVAYGQPGTSAADVLSRADTAMYQAKGSPSPVAVYAGQPDDAAECRPTVRARELRHVVSGGR
jgi:diguanylate cyclase (GGDEF)-like protein